MAPPPPLAALLALVVLWPGLAAAGESEPVRAETVTARLLTAEDGVAPAAARLSAGLHLDLAEGWKTYWRSPGEVGLPPELEWAGSRNVADARILWPAPTRFTAFGIENFGYGGEVLLPLEVTLERPGEPARLAVEAHLLVCSDICVPETVSLALDLPAGGGVDRAAAAEIAAWAGRVPEEGGAARAHLGEALTIEVEGRFADPDVFPELGRAAFGRPEIRAEGDRLWASLPLLAEPREGEGPLRVTVTDGARAVTVEPGMAGAPIPADAGGPGLLWIAGVALLGGLVLNVMPCVLPVLGIKLAGAVAVAGAAPGRVRAGFLASAAGVVAFMWALGGLVLAAKAAGLAVGWGVQFQNPVFLAAMVAVTGLFAANLAGGFEIALPGRAADAMGLGGPPGLAGDFATGAFAAVLATPCSAPFLGTAVAFALAGGTPEVALVFTMLGLGLALPYLAVAARPSIVRRLPRPGPWMLRLRVVLALMLLATALWLAWVLSSVAGARAALAVAGLVALAGLLATLRPRLGRAALPAAAAVLLAAVLAPAVLPPQARAATQGAWVPFDREGIAERVAGGEVVFVDVTADWCLTCQANKRLVLDRGAVADRLASDAVVAMRADWTRPDEAIRRYLEDHGRYGIPFNAAYGPGRPDGVPLPEVLTPGLVADALDAAAGTGLAAAE